MDLKQKILLLTLLLAISSPLYAKSPDVVKGLDGALIVVLSNGEATTGEVVAKLGANGNSLIHVIASDQSEVSKINSAVAKAGLKGLITVQVLGIKKLPYRDYMVNDLVVMDTGKAAKAGFTIAEAKRCVAPFGKIVICNNGQVDAVEDIPMLEGMDDWTHRYRRANGLPHSTDKYFDLPVGFKWNAGLPNYFSNPERASNRYSSTRSLLAADGRVFMLSTAVYENLGDTFNSKFGTDQYLTCRDAFNGRLLWRKRIGSMYYGGLYVENTAPMVAVGRTIYLPSDNGKMLKVDTRTGETLKELPTEFIPGVIAADDGIVVTATWKEGKQMGAVLQFDRRRMDWAIEIGTIEAYDHKTSQQLWKKNVLGTSMLIDDGRVFIVSREGKDGLEFIMNRPLDDKQKALFKNLRERGLMDKVTEKDPKTFTRPKNWLMAFDLRTGKELWEKHVEGISRFNNQTISLESATAGIIRVTTTNRNRGEYFYAETGEYISDVRTAADKLKDFFIFRQHLCTPAFKVNDIFLNNRFGVITKGKESVRVDGARGACLLGTTPAYGAGYIPQNWCNCSAGQIQGLIAIGPVGTLPTPQEMEDPVAPQVFSEYIDTEDGVAYASTWSTFRGNALRTSSTSSKINLNPKEVWLSKVVADTQKGTVALDWRSFLNSRLTAAVLTDTLAIVGDIDQNEIVAVNLADGKVAWRFATGGRMDAAPTLYKGICLASDRTGYVYALKVKSGKLIYKLRAAPQEKRMLSYGKVESPWPVIGGVLVHNGKAYVSVGRSEGGDGGIVVRSFKPETGEQIWAKAIGQKGPRESRRNDALLIDHGTLRVMDNYMDPATGKFVKSAKDEYIAKVLPKEVKEIEDLQLKIDKADDKAKRLLVRERMIKQNTLNRSTLFAMRKPEAPKTLDIGYEGIYSWNWQHLGSRKFLGFGMKTILGSAFAWNDKGYSWNQMGSVTQNRFHWIPETGRATVMDMKVEYQNTSIVVCENAVVSGGRIIGKDTRNTGKKGFIQILDIATGKVTLKKKFDAELAFNGLAVDNGQIVATFNDGFMMLMK